MNRYDILKGKSDRPASAKRAMQAGHSLRFSLTPDQTQECYSWQKKHSRKCIMERAQYFYTFHPVVVAGTEKSGLVCSVGCLCGCKKHDLTDMSDKEVWGE